MIDAILVFQSSYLCYCLLLSMLRSICLLSISLSFCMSICFVSVCQLSRVSNYRFCPIFLLFGSSFLGLHNYSIFNTNIDIRVGDLLFSLPPMTFRHSNFESNKDLTFMRVKIRGRTRIQILSELEFRAGFFVFIRVRAHP